MDRFIIINDNWKFVESVSNKGISVTDKINNAIISEDEEEIICLYNYLNTVDYDTYRLMKIDFKEVKGE